MLVAMQRSGLFSRCGSVHTDVDYGAVVRGKSRAGADEGISLRVLYVVGEDSNACDELLRCTELAA